jgi:hypothetical protein
MSAEQKPALRRIRTFAQDAAAAQGNSTDTNTKGTPATNAPANIVVSVPTEKAAAAKVFATQTPHKEPEKPKPATPVLPHEEHIPAFHELQKKSVAADATVSTAHTTPKIPTIQAEPPKKVTVRSKKRDLTKKVTASGGTIITDTKRNEVNFFDSLLTSMKAWFASLNKTFTTKKTPTYTVTDVERRKGVIQKATSKSGSIFTADNETLREEIRRRNQTVVTAPHEVDITWTPQTEPGFALLEEHSEVMLPPAPVPTTPVVPVTPKLERVVVEFKKKSLPEPVITQPSIPEPIIVPVPAPLPPISEPAPNPVSGYDSYVETPAPVVAVAVAPVVTPPVEVPKISEPIKPEVILDREPEPAPIQTPSAPAQNLFIRLYDAVRFSTNTLTLGIAGSLVAIIIIVFVTRMLVGVLIPTNKHSTVTAATTLLISSSTVTDLTLPMLSQENLLEKLKTVEVIDSVPKEIRLAGSTGIPLSTQVTLQLVGLGTSKNFIQTASDVHLITINAQHALVVKITDPTVALGSLLSFEPLMAENVHTYLGFAAPAVLTTFSDATIATHDVRILTSEGKELMVYGFISANTILIAEDTTSFKAILGSH